MVANKELLFGLVAPLGIDLESVFSHMEQALEVFRYQPVTISITQFLQQRTSLVDLPVGIPFDDRIDKLQGAGNRFRQEFGRKDAMALAAIAGIVMAPIWRLRCSLRARLPSLRSWRRWLLPRAASGRSRCRRWRKS